MDYFGFIGIVESPPVLLVDVALAGSIKCRGKRIAAMTSADDLGGEMIDCHSPLFFPLSPSDGAVTADCRTCYP
jgi:hypothetical protein